MSKISFFTWIVISDYLFSPGLTSDYTPTSDARALADAQRELCDMLGITLEELQPGGPTLKRRGSTSDVGMLSANSPILARRNSIVATPARTKDEVSCNIQLWVSVLITHVTHSNAPLYWQVLAWSLTTFNAFFEL